jgi:hypothetical protein
MKRLSLIAAAIAMCVAASSANATTIHYTLYLGQYAQGPGTFKVTASTDGDNQGIAAYSVQLVGNGGANILTTNHDSLRGTDVETASPGGDPGPVGFTLLRTADKTGGAATALMTISGSQDTTDPSAHIIYGFGQSSGSIASKGLNIAGGSVPEGNNWGGAGVNGPGHTALPGEFEIARGTYTPNANGGGTPAIGFPSPLGELVAGSTFNATGSTATTIAQVTTQVVVPEPATLGLGALSLLGCVFAARRKMA